MSAFNRIVWTEGLFLQPQHFQQQDRHVEHWVEARTAPLAAYPWGVVELQLDDAALAMGRVAVLRIRGVFPDGTPIDAPRVDALPPALDVPADAKNAVVVLAIPGRRPGVQECSLGGEQDAALMRYSAQDAELRDATTSLERHAPVQLGRLNARLMLHDDAVEAHQMLGLLRVIERKADNRLLLDNDYIGPMLNVAGHPRLAALMGEVLALFHHRGDALAARLGKPGAGGVAEIADFLMLQCINRYEPLFDHYSKLYLAHPRELYALCLEAAGELSIFAPGTRRPRAMPQYLHDDLPACFGAVVRELRALLSTVLEQKAIPIELVDRKYGVRTATVADLELLRAASFVLAVNAQLPGEQLRTRFPTQVKIGPVERIRDLVNLQLPGVALRGLPVAPREIPYHAGFHYFELERNGDLWEQLQKTGHLAMHVAGDFPGLEMEFWAIRQG
ncbi:MAG: type VI secretion system baseplate subunit TssK [Betaproteobacteria bacterium]|nr:type VI secretion system baseplate subunit TssK [Betaproteobacteria bacterium]